MSEILFQNFQIIGDVSRYGGVLLVFTKISRSEIIRFVEEKWPKSGIPDAFGAKIGYLSIPVTAKALGRHLIGQRRPPPDAGHFCAG